ncbi:Beta-galactosidase [Euphorbia peplus]|nr:Beta-galactosidase [Euphorbia peplus]
MINYWHKLLVIFGLNVLHFCACKVEYDSKAIIINGERKLILSGSIHYPRSTPQMWPDLINKGKLGGLDAIETYIFWNAHEPQRRQYDFSGNRDFISFFKQVQKAGLYGILRIGPYACAEWNYGGFPVWLHNIPGIKLRTDNDIFKREMQTFTTKIVEMVKEAKLFASQGGPIILSQIENEYGNIMGPYGEAGKSYVEWCAQMAVAQNTGVPWIMCQQADAPSSVINTCNGFYCDEFTPNNPKSPKMWTENWTGWFKKWGQKDPHRPAEDVAFAVARFFQFGGILQNYYMYHGGTNFGRTAGGPLIVTSYDYDAPLDEYGNLNQPKWGHLKNLHSAIKSGEKILTSNNSSATTQKLNDGWVELTTYTNNGTGERLCFLSNTNTEDYNVDLKQDGTFSVPAWSVSILQGCNEEIFNTAKVNVQTSVMVKKLNKKDKPKKLSWMWLQENITDALNGKGNLTANKLLEQKAVTSDESDYLWYIARIINNATTPKKLTLQVNFSGQSFYNFVNGASTGSQVGPNSTFTTPVTLKSGTNILSLLSITVGLPNYGSFYDEIPQGIAGGPVKLTDENNATLYDLTSLQWTYKIALDGVKRRLFDPKSRYGKQFSTSGGLPVGKAMTWYKTTFVAPSGSEAVVLDLQGMGKGEAWINGQSIGRYWPKQMADSTGCQGTCDYRGKYDPDHSSCATNCANPSQRWYHVPRSFFNKKQNTLVLFEEIGGNPSSVSFQIVTTETICGNAYPGTKLQLSCTKGQVISDIQFASFGDPKGTCGSFPTPNSDVSNTITNVKKACVGKNSCSVAAPKAASKNGDKFVVQALCAQH